MQASSRRHRPDADCLRLKKFEGGGFFSVTVDVGVIAAVVKPLTVGTTILYGMIVGGSTPLDGIYIAHPEGMAYSTSKIPNFLREANPLMLNGLLLMVCSLVSNKAK
jgi:hypothetical protein